MEEWRYQGLYCARAISLHEAYAFKERKVRKTAEILLRRDVSRRLHEAMHEDWWRLKAVRVSYFRDAMISDIYASRFMRSLSRINDYTTKQYTSVRFSIGISRVVL